IPTTSFGFAGGAAKPKPVVVRTRAQKTTMRFILLRSTDYRCGEKPNVSESETLRAASIVIWSPGAGRFDAVEAGFTATMLCLSKRLLIVKRTFVWENSD